VTNRSQASQRLLKLTLKTHQLRNLRRRRPQSRKVNDFELLLLYANDCAVEVESDESDDEANKPVIVRPHPRLSGADRYDFPAEPVNLLKKGNLSFIFFVV